MGARNSPFLAVLLFAQVMGIVAAIVVMWHAYRRDEAVAGSNAAAQTAFGILLAAWGAQWLMLMVPGRDPLGGLAFSHDPLRGLALIGIVTVALCAPAMHWVIRSRMGRADRIFVGSLLAIVVASFTMLGLYGLLAFPLGTVAFLFPAVALAVHFRRPLASGASAAVGILIGTVALADWVAALPSASKPPALLNIIVLSTAAFGIVRAWRGGRVQRPAPAGPPAVEPGSVPAANVLARPEPPVDRVRGEGWAPPPRTVERPPVLPHDPEPVERVPAPAREPSGVITGVVRNFRERFETSPDQNQRPDIVWTFRVERYHEGHRQPPVAVEMRAKSFRGAINEGDTVRLRSGWRPGSTVRTKRVHNVTSGETVQGKTDLVRQLVALVSAVIIITIFVKSCP